MDDLVENSCLIVLYKIRTAPLSERYCIENYHSKIIAGVLKNEKHQLKPEQIPANFSVLFNLLNIIIIIVYRINEIKGNFENHKVYQLFIENLAGNLYICLNPPICIVFLSHFQ